MFKFHVMGLLFEKPGSSGLGPVTALPEVPGVGADDLDTLGGDDDENQDESEGTENSDEQDDQTDDETGSSDEGSEGEGEGEEGEIDEELDAKDDDKDDKDEIEDKGPKLPSIRGLKKDYPDIFKKHPEVRVAIAEHSQFKNIFTSPKEAQEAADVQDSFATISDALVDRGDFAFLYDEVAKADPAAATRLVKNILPALQEKNRELYYDIIDEPITAFVAAAYSRAKRDGNKNLENSALHFWKTFMGRDGMPGISQSGPDPREKEFEDKRRQFETTQYRDSQQTVNGDIMTGLTPLIEREIDPNNKLQPTLRRALISELTRLIDEDLTGDQNHMRRMDRLWANARRASYAKGHTSRIISAYLERAKQVLPKHARKVREENKLKSDQPKGNGQSRESNEPPPRPNAHGNASRPRTIRDANPRSIDWNRTSDMDVLSGKATLKGRR
jgi:hypothetical protein